METLMFKPCVCAVMAAALPTGTGARAAESPADRDIEVGEYVHNLTFK